MENIRWWLGDLADEFEENKSVLDNLDLTAEARLGTKVNGYISRNASSPAHDLDHHRRVRTFTTVVGVTNGYDMESIKVSRYAALLHDLLKKPGKGGKGPHNWSELRKLAIDLMDKADIEDRYVPRVINVIEEHHEDNPSKRSRDGNALYEGDTTDITFLPRCFDLAESFPDFYPTMDRVIEDYNKYQVNPSTPITHSGKRMFEVGKGWALPTLDRLNDRLGDRNLAPYFPFLGVKWKRNMSKAPSILKETLDTYREILPHYEISI